MARAELDVGELLMKLVARETGEISKVDYHPQKPEFSHDTVIGETRLLRQSPESQGVSSAFFVELIRKLSETKECNIHKFMALRHGKVIAECAFEPYDMDMWHVSYSMCKSIVGMAIGILIDEGKLSLDEKISDIFSSRMNPFGFLRKNVTVKNLLNMSSGVDFYEAGAISGNDWRKSFLEAGFKFDPGTQFEYNSMNTYMLSAIITEKTGESCFDYCKEKIFVPLGIQRVYWESCPQSITKGGWGLFIRIEDMAKLGQLYLQNGMWDGKQIVPADWVKESTSWQIETNKGDNSHYGYQLWINDDRPGSFAYNGMLGQNVFVYPDIDMVVVTNAGNSDIFQTSKMAVMIRNAMKDDIEVSDIPLPEDFSSLNSLKAICKSVSGRNNNFPVIYSGGWKNKAVRMTTGSARLHTSSYSDKRGNFKSQVRSFNVRKENHLIHEWLSKLDGRTYDIEQKGVGIFPLMMQVVHNNFTDGINKIGFRLCDDNSFYIDIYEGIEVYSLRCGFGGKRYISSINMHGEVYEVSLVSYCVTDEYNRLVIRNEINFLEEACLRTFNIFFYDDAADRDDRKGTFIHPSVPSRLEVRLMETPGTDMLINTMKTMAPDALSGMQGKVVSKFFKGGIKEAIEHAVNNTIQPTINGVLSLPSTPEPALDTPSEPVDAK
ncbi:beta-lactamase family protein [Butyrivibrio proteoclasticus B316]|uniref:Beta-lactamase family protein n=1 Tax=Butyrivibrio proteoclasticus (strain ATCC 51982 / DSM 14932 / B316) TaxID=515622 RepID=E0RWG7_BUTPB|nr:serine hydrolase [Butyrivibrio proteoclasticus]ADL34265.1 beta-lactamase family protein [Butyrivibrio proteoclasticus B316]